MKKVFLVLLSIIAIGVSAFVVVGNLFYTETPNYSKLMKGVIVLIGYLYVLAKIMLKGKTLANLFGTNYRKYEKEYKDMLDGTFTEDKKSYKNLLKATVYYNENKYNKAHHTLDELAKKCIRSKDYSTVYMFKALCYADENKREQAIEAYQKVVQYDMANSRAWSNMGICYVSLGKMQEAFDSYSNAIRHNPENEMAYSNMASFLLRVGEPQEALQHALKALELNGKLYQAMSAASMAYKMLGDDEKSEKFCKMYGVNGGNAKELRSILETM